MGAIEQAVTIEGDKALSTGCLWWDHLSSLTTSPVPLLLCEEKHELSYGTYIVAVLHLVPPLQPEMLTARAARGHLVSYKCTSNQ